MRYLLTLLVACLLIPSVAAAEKSGERDYRYRFETGGVLVYTGKQTNQFKQETGESL